MVVLTYPMFSVKNCLNKDSNYIFLRNTIQEMLRQRDDIYFLFVFPSNKGWKYEPDPEFWNHSRIIPVPIKLPTGKRENVVHFDYYTWKRIFDKYTPDIIWNQVTEIGHLLKYFISTFNPKCRPVVINQHHYVIHKTLPYSGMEHIRDMQLIGTKLVDFNVFNTEYTRKMFEETAHDQFDDGYSYTGDVIKFGLLKRELFERFDVGDKFDTFTIIYNHRLQAYKNYKDTFDLLYELYREGLKFKAVVTGEGSRSQLSGYPFIEFKEDLYAYEDYITYISQGHLNVTNSQYETFCITGIESMALGQVLVAPNGVTFPELVKPGYEYLFKSKIEQKEKIRDLINLWYEDRKKFIELVANIKEYTLDNFTIEAFVARYLELFDRMTFFDMKNSLKPQNKRHVVEYLKKNKVAVDKLHNIWRGLIDGHFGAQAFPPLKIKRILNEMGYKDTFFNKEQYLMLKKD